MKIASGIVAFVAGLAVLFMAQPASGVSPVLAFSLQATGAQSCLGALSFEAGTSWTYSGTRVRSDGAGGRLSEPVRWTTSIEASRTEGEAGLALIRGFVTELAWSKPDTEPRLSLLACSDGRLIRVTGESEERIRLAYEEWDASMASTGQLLLETPLRHGQLFGQTPVREDAFYGWSVELVDMPSDLPDSCESDTSLTHRLSYRTMPDHQFVEWHSGIGIASYEYVHHGSPGDASVVLESCNLLRRPTR
jgi:hypothetical protein